MVKRSEKPYVVAVKSKGRTYHYFRRAGVYERLPDDPDSPEFDEAYWALRSGKTHTKRAVKTTFDALIQSYYQSPRFQRLAEGTKKEYRRTLELIREKNGPKDFTRLRTPDVIAARDAYASTWRKANAMVETISILARHAITLGWISHNPAQGVEKLTGGEYEPWPEAVQDAFVAYCEEHDLTVPLIAYHLCTGTGQRIGDVCKMEWDHFDGDYVEVMQEKTGARIWVYCPARLKAFLSSLPKTGRYILAKNLTQPLTKRRVQEQVKAVIDAIGATGLVIHGWRYTAAVELAEAGCSDSEIQSVTGHASLEMVRKYRSRANQKRLSKAAQSRRNGTSTERESVKPSVKPGNRGAD